MKKFLPIIMIATLALSGCVTTGKYNLKVEEAMRFQSEILTLRKNLFECVETLKQTAAERDSLASVKNEMEIALYGLKQNISDLEASSTDLRNTLSSTQSQKDSLIASLSNTRQNLESDLVDLKQEVMRLENQRDQLTARLQDLEARNQSILDEKQELETKLAGLEPQVDKLNQENQLLKDQLNKISAEKAITIENLKNAQNELINSLQKEIQQGQIEITQLQDKLSVNIIDKIMFQSGQAEVSPEGEAVLARVGPVLKKLGKQQIRIEGHTDNVRIGRDLRSTYFSNWELSTARATNVVHYLIDKMDIDPGKISATGYSQFRPLVSNRTSDERAKNRRIEIVVVPVDVDRVIARETNE